MFVTFEGPEGAGKSTAIRTIASELQASGHRVLVTREPGAGEFGAKVREILLHSEEMPAESELFLFLADRSHHVRRIIEPALAEGKIVLCDRYADSTLVYQSYARGLNEGFVRSANAFAIQGRIPDLTLLFDLPPEEGLRRLTSPDRLDREPIEFHRKVREGFLEEAKSNPERWFVLDASQRPEALADAALLAILALSKRKGSASSGA